jgi:hypothetical protein
MTDEGRDDPGSPETTVSSQWNDDPVLGPLTSRVTTYLNPGRARPVVVKRTFIRETLP